MLILMEVMSLEEVLASDNDYARASVYNVLEQECSGGEDNWAAHCKERGYYFDKDGRVVVLSDDNHKKFCDSKDVGGQLYRQLMETRHERAKLDDIVRQTAAKLNKLVADMENRD